MCQKVVAKVKMSQEIRTCMPLIFGVFMALSMFQRLTMATNRHNCESVRPQGQTQLTSAISYGEGTGPMETVLLDGVMLVLPSEPQT